MTKPITAAIKVAVVYWALLLFGIALYSVIRMDDIHVLSPVWSGAIAGTAIGQILAARRYRWWFVVVVVVLAGMFWIPQLPEDISHHAVWMAFLPAALCGFWSLGDRTSLGAFWFPAVIWMLSILDGANAQSLPDTDGLMLLGALAVMFVVFLRVREERRVALWRTVSPSQLAVVKQPVTLQEVARAPRIVWGVIVSALGFAATMWLAPKLWQPESLDGGKVIVASQDPQIGVPCCPKYAVAPTTRARVKEYFDLGRSHERVEKPTEEMGCRVCVAAPIDVQTGPSLVGGPDMPSGGGGGGYGDYHWTPSGGGGAAPNTQSTYTPEAPSQSPTPMPTPTPPAVPVPSAVASSQVPSSAPQAPTPPSLPSHVQSPSPHAPSQLPPPAPSSVTPPPPPPPSIADHPPVTTGAPPTLRAPTSHGSFALRWAALLAGGVLLSQLFALALRPVRRAIALRHFERPFWDETVDQRVSNAWQLALVGLRDAGFRASATESPTAFAKRVDVEGLDRCATILERARHGIGIDRDDLADMTTSAATAYRAARARASLSARSLAWMRWPLA